MSTSGCLTGIAFGALLVAAGCKTTHVGADALGGATGSGGGAAGATASGSGGATGAAGSGSGGASQGSGGSSGSDAAAGSTGGDPCATALFCDDFESYAADGAPGKPGPRRPPWARSPSTARRPARARSRSNYHAGQDQRHQDRVHAPRRRGDLPVPATSFYGRMMFRLAAAPETSVHWTIIQGSGVVPGQSYHALYRYGGQLPVHAGREPSSAASSWRTTRRPTRTHGTGPGQRLLAARRQGRRAGREVVLRRMEVRRRERPDDLLAGRRRGRPPDRDRHGRRLRERGRPASSGRPDFDRLDLGWESYQPDGARTIWIDDVVLFEDKVGCPRTSGNSVG